jgi:hypothetical protein
MTVSTLRSYPSVVRDGLQEASGRGGHVQKLLKGANALMATIDKLEKLMRSLQAIGEPRGSASLAAPTPFSGSSFMPSSAAKPAVELNPAAKRGPAEGGAAPTAPRAAPAPRPPSGRSL